MPDNRWQQIEELYHEALKRAPVTRAAYLDEVCTGRRWLAQLGLARATQSRKAYDDFLAAWKEADADVPILREAKREAALAANR